MIFGKDFLVTVEAEVMQTIIHPIQKGKDFSDFWKGIFCYNKAEIDVDFSRIEVVLILISYSYKG